MGVLKNLWNTTVKVVKATYEVGKEIGKAAVQKCRELITSVEEKVVNFVEKRVQRVKKRVEEKKYRVEVLGHKHDTQEEPADQKLAADSTNYLKTKFQSGITTTLKEQTKEQREETIKTVFNDVKQIMGVEDVDIEIDYFGTSSCGFYAREDNKVYINKAYLELDDPQIACEQVFTVFHELNHARQCAAITGKKDFGYSDQRLLEWALNWKYYISPRVSDKAYRMQPMEADSFRLEEKLKVAMNENIVFLGC